MVQIEIPHSWCSNDHSRAAAPSVPARSPGAAHPATMWKHDLYRSDKLPKEQGGTVPMRYFLMAFVVCGDGTDLERWADEGRRISPPLAGSGLDVDRRRCWGACARTIESH